jgi:hypothetical protein
LAVPLIAMLSKNFKEEDRMRQSKKPFFRLLMVGTLAMFIITGSRCEKGGDGGGGTRDCIPCGDLDLLCRMDCNITGCPVCFSIDEDSGEMKMVYEDGSYHIGGHEGVTFYDSNGEQCFAFVIDIAENKTTYIGSDGEVCYSIILDIHGDEATFVVDSKKYILHEDGTWTCPNGTTWVIDPSCTGGPEYEEVEAPDVADCPPLMEFCAEE